MPEIIFNESIKEDLPVGSVVVANLFFLFFTEHSVVFAQDFSETKEIVKKAGENKSNAKKIEIILGIDRIEKFDYSPSANVQVGNESIVTYQLIPSKREITLKGRKPGKTSVIVRDQVGDIKSRFLITVTANDQSNVIQELREYLGAIEGIDIGIKGGQAYVGGKIVVPGDIGLINIILKKYPDILQLVELHPQSQRIVAEKMQSEIQKNGLPDVSVRIVNKLYWLEGVVRTDDEKTRAENIALAYLPDRILTLAEREDSVQKAVKPIVQNFIVVNRGKRKPSPLEKLIKVTAQFVELSKDYSKIFGFKWNPALGGSGGNIAFGKSESGGVVTKSNGTLSGVISNLFPKLSTAKSAGFARIVQSGVLIVKDGESGTIKKTTLHPFAIGNTEFVRSEKAEAGFSLQATPSIVKDEQIELKLGIGVSSLVGDPPKTLNNELKTQLIVKSKESAVVGGVAINTNSTDFDKNPPGGPDKFEEGSPLFSFIRSKSYQTAKNQFVVFVTPQIIESASDGTAEIQKKFRKRGR